MKEVLFKNWHVMRLFRLAFASFLFYQAFASKEWFFIAFGFFFMIQALFNFGCGANGCAIPNKKSNER